MVLTQSRALRNSVNHQRNSARTFSQSSLIFADFISIYPMIRRYQDSGKKRRKHWQVVMHHSSFIIQNFKIP